MLKCFRMPLALRGVFFAALILCAGCRPADKPALQLDQAALRYSPDPVAGETIRPRVLLTRVGTSDVAVVRTETSCGCTQVKYEGVAVEPSQGFVVRQSQSSLEVEIDTKLKYGRTPFSYKLQYRDPHTAVTHWLYGVVEVNVRLGLSAEPTSLRIHTRSNHGPAVVSLYDDVDGAGLGIRECIVSDPDFMDIELVPVLATTAGADPSGRGRKLRYELKLRLAQWDGRGQGSKRGWIRVVPEHPDAAALQIPIQFMDEPELELTPRQLVISTPAVPVTRTVSLVSRSPWTSNPRLEYPAHFCEVDIEPGFDDRERIITLRLTEKAVGQSFDVSFHADQQSVRLPVTVLAEAAVPPSTMHQ